MGGRPRLLLCSVSAFLSACSGARAPLRAAEPQRAAQAEHARALTVLDDFEHDAGWRAEGSDDVYASASEVSGREGRGLSLGFDFRGHGGFAALKRALPLELPEHYELSFTLAGDAPINDFQVKFADASGENVWWFRKNDFAFAKEWQEITIKQRQIEFAWGPTKERAFKRVATVEFVVAAGRDGGKGSFKVDDLRLRALSPPVAPPVPSASASSSVNGEEPARALDGQLQTQWRSAPGQDKAQTFTLDLGAVREFGGLVLRWRESERASDYDVELSRDGERYEPAKQVRGARGARDALLMTESEARFVRLSLRAGPGPSYALAELELKDLAFGASQNAFVSALAREAPRGHYPRGFSGEQPYWTLVGSDGSAESGLLSEDGALEVGAGGFTVEPFVLVDGRLISWADVQIEHALSEGYLPSPSARWLHKDFALEVDAFANEAQSSAELWGRYVLSNRRTGPLKAKLVLAIRPYQVNPATQFLNIAGGVSPIRALAWDGAGLAVNGRTRVWPVVAPAAVGLASFYESGGLSSPLPNFLPKGEGTREVRDETGLASAALVYEFDLAAGQSVTLGLMAPLGEKETRARAPTLAELNEQRAQTLARWREKLGRVGLRVPAAGRQLVDSLRSALAHILMSRSGPVLRPGTRSYARSWIRDGAMMAEALLRLGHEQVARDYLRWFAPYLFENGKVPCCVDRRGADPVVENDSAGEFIFLVAELFYFTKDRALLESMWPQVAKATRYLEQLRASERSAQNQEPARRAFYGLMPRSISHEGYSDRPAYSYWDDFWTLIGYEQATALAELLGQHDQAHSLSRARDEFRTDLMSSLRESAAQHGVDYLPGSADRGDFDATSTTIALSPGQDQEALPREQLHATFERYFREFEARRDGKRAWSDYTPYELRVVASFVRLGARERAEQLLAFFFRDQRPQGWNQWAEVVGREPREPRFIGDMPHAWIASDYIRSALDLFAYTRPASAQLVLAAGVPISWFAGSGIAVERLRTPFGELSYSARQQGKQLVFTIASPAPPGGFAIPWPWREATGSASIDGKPARLEGAELRVPHAPARVVFTLR